MPYVIASAVVVFLVLLLAVYFLSGYQRRQAGRQQQPQAAPAQPGQQQAQAGQPQAQAAQAGAAAPGWFARNVEPLFKVLLATASLTLIVFCMGVAVMIVLSVIKGIKSTAQEIDEWIMGLPAATQAPAVPETLAESSLSAGEVQSWMYSYLSDEKSGWYQLKLVHQHHMSGREGWEPLPINLAFMDGGYVVVRPLYGTEGLGVDFSASISDQYRPGLELLSPHGGRAEIGTDGGPLVAHLTPRWNLRGPFKFAFEVEVLPPKTQRLWIGRYCVLGAGQVSYFGHLPLTIKDEPVDWTVRVHFLPADTDGDGVLPFPHLRADYYTTRWHEVALGVEEPWDAAVWENKDPDDPVAAQALIRARARALIYARVRQNSWLLSSSEAREACRNGTLPEKAWFGCMVHEPLVVQIVVLFH